MSVPSSVIHILSDVPLNNSYEHSLYFPTKEHQDLYFLGYHRVKTFQKYTYLRPGNVIKVAGDIANARSWNYLMFQNDAGKWYYHFITKVVYLGENSVELHIELDVIQTYMFDWELNQCFVERIHTATDNIGDHTIDEGLETGELVDLSVTDYMFKDMCILMLSAVDDAGSSAWSKVYDGVFSGLRIDAIRVEDYAELGTWLDDMSTAGKIDAVVSMWMYPKDLVQIDGSWTNGAVRHRVTGFSTTTQVEVQPHPQSTVNGYVPKNNKLFTYPYSMLYVTNNMGGSAVYKRELFSGASDAPYLFKIMGALSPDSGVQLVPYGYNGSSVAYDYGLSIGAFPTCAWDSDTYKVWLAQNQNSHDLAVKQSVIQAGVGVATALGSIMTGNLIGSAGGVGVAYNAISNVQGLMAQKADMEIQPPQARGNHSGNINLAHDRMGFSFHFKSVKAEMAASIDNYFSRYGYKVNRVMRPSLKNRERFTYIKTQGCFVTGPLGAEDQLKIQAIFDKGITFWADHDSVGVFTTDNPCL